MPMRLPCAPRCARPRKSNARSVRASLLSSTGRPGWRKRIRSRGTRMKAVRYRRSPCARTTSWPRRGATGNGWMRAMQATNGVRRHASRPLHLLPSRRRPQNELTQRRVRRGRQYGTPRGAVLVSARYHRDSARPKPQRPTDKILFSNSTKVHAAMYAST